MKNTLTLKALQMNYIAAKLSKEEETDHRCPFCWESKCDHNSDIHNDPFINMTEELKIG